VKKQSGKKDKEACQEDKGARKQSGKEDKDVKKQSGKKDKDMWQRRKIVPRRQGCEEIERQRGQKT
jgi:hypothetical protein